MKGALSERQKIHIVDIRSASNQMMAALQYTALGRVGKHVR